MKPTNRCGRSRGEHASRPGRHRHPRAIAPISPPATRLLVVADAEARIRAVAVLLTDLIAQAPTPVGPPVDSRRSMCWTR